MPILKHIDFQVPAFRELDAPPTVVPTYRDAVMALSPIAYWRLGESAGTAANDETGQHDLTLSSGYSLGETGALVQDANTAALFTDGSAAYTGPILPTTAGAALSIACWVRFPNPITSVAAFLGQYQSGVSGRMLCSVLSDATVRFAVVGDIAFDTNAALDNAWRMLVLTRDTGGGLSWYIDGRLDTQTTASGAGLGNAPFRLGRNTSASPNVELDEACLFDYALTAEQVRWLHGLAGARLNLPA